MDRGNIIVTSNGDENDAIKAELSSASDGSWHYVNVLRSKNELQLHLDDYVSKKVPASELTDALPSDDIQITLGRKDNRHFIGCIGDVIVNEKLTNFADYVVKEVKLIGCTMGDEAATEAVTTSTQRGVTEEEPNEPEGIPEKEVFKN